MSLYFWFDPILEARAEILEKISLVIRKKFGRQKGILKLTDLYKVTMKFQIRSILGGWKKMGNRYVVRKTDETRSCRDEGKQQACKISKPWMRKVRTSSRHLLAEIRTIHAQWVLDWVIIIKIHDCHFYSIFVTFST